MAQKATELIHIIEMINCLKRENFTNIDIIQILKEENMASPEMSDADLQIFLSKLSNISSEEALKLKYISCYKWIILPTGQLVRFGKTI